MLSAAVVLFMGDIILNQGGFLYGTTLFAFCNRRPGAALAVFVLTGFEDIYWVNGENTKRTRKPHFSWFVALGGTHFLLNCFVNLGKSGLGQQFFFVGGTRNFFFPLQSLFFSGAGDMYLDFLFFAFFCSQHYFFLR